jgi:hypothetical protein
LLVAAKFLFLAANQVVGWRMAASVVAGIVIGMLFRRSVPTKHLRDVLSEGARKTFLRALDNEITFSCPVAE